MVVKRKSVFETNSSSVHALVIDQSGLELSKLLVNNKTNKVNVKLGYFGANYELFGTQLEKLSYLVTYAACYSGLYCTDNKHEILNTLYNNSIIFRYIDEVIKEYCNCSGIEIKIPSKSLNYYSWGFDHQMHPNNHDCIIDIWDKESIKNFIFNKYITLQTYHD